MNNLIRDSQIFQELSFRKGFELRGSLGFILVMISYQSINTKEKRTNIVLSIRAGFDPALKAAEILFQWAKKKFKKKMDEKEAKEDEESNPSTDLILPNRNFFLTIR
jgi:hypothetical protein